MEEINLKMDINKNVMKRYDKEITDTKAMLDSAFTKVVEFRSEGKRVLAENH